MKVFNLYIIYQISFGIQAVMELWKSSVHIFNFSLVGNSFYRIMLPERYTTDFPAKYNR